MISKESVIYSWSAGYDRICNLETVIGTRIYTQKLELIKSEDLTKKK
ncbi:Uncharacterised protein [Chryseobacterium indoltheticum]|uniref:Uncharacterized protein n=1 Tax=Chryseobacterium indoltheticum TaxID=254 RepID=A0A381FPF7_9FLAO|nr:Uncharacterised protein [Chryseobacterium indoltheticum]